MADPKPWEVDYEEPKPWEVDYEPPSDSGIPKFQPTGVSLVPPTAADIQEAEAERNPLKGAGRGFATIGKGLVAGAADLGRIFFRPVTEQMYPEQAEAGPVAPENLQAFMQSGGVGPLPAEDLRVLPKSAQIVGRAAQGLIETTPKLAGVTALQAGGIPAPIAAGAIFGLTPEGFDPKQAAIAAALPYVGKYSGQMVEALASKLGVTKDAALAIWNKLGGATGAAGYLKAIDESEIAKLPPEQRDQARIDSWANVASQAALGVMGEREPKKPGAPPVTGESLKTPEGAQPPSETVRKLMEEGVNRPDADALVAGKKTVKDVVEGAFAKFITPAWNANVTQAQGGHAEAWIQGYRDATERLSKILEEKPAAEAAQPKETSASIEQTPATVHGDVLPLAGEGKGQVPVKEGEPRVQPEAEGGIQEAQVIDEPTGPGESARFTTKLPEGYATGFIKEGKAELVGIEVEKAARRKGIGEKLLREFADKAKASGATSIAGDFVPGAKALMDKVFGEPVSSKPVEDWPEGMGEPPIRSEYSLTPKTDPSVVAKEIGFEHVKSKQAQIGAITIPEDLSKYSPEDRAKFEALKKKYPKQWEFTDKRKGSPTEGITFYTPEGASRQEILDAYKAKVGGPTETTTPPTKTSQRPTLRGLQTKTPSPAMSEAGFIDLSSLNDFFDKVSGAVKSSARFVRDVAKEVSGLEKMTDYRRSVLNWSAKLQRSFGEAARVQRDITDRVKDPLKREAITNWIQADGDPVVLRQQASASKNPKLRAGYEAALNLTPDELAVANEVRQRYAALARRGQRYDVLDNLKDNYVTQIWDLGKGPTGQPTPSGSAMGRTLKQKFRFSKARTFPNFFVGEQADFVPKTKDISKLLPVYMHEMESVIAARELVEQMSQGTASDGRPLTAPVGVGIPVEKPSGDKATLVFPKIAKEEFKDYKVLQNQPALTNWKWAAKDDAGNNIFLKADVALHPEAYNKLKNVLGKSAIKEWYQTPTSRVMDIPKALVKGLDMANSEVKKTMLGVLSPFHQVQEATHAAGHRVNPAFNIPEIDLVRNKDQMDAARHGLMLQPDRASENQFMEGFKQSKIISKIPALGPASDWYSNYLFHEYIPGLKYKTYQSILDRNTKRYAKDLAAGKVGIEDVKTLSAEQANAAFGHLNYADLGRNSTIQHLAQLGILAPDFFESRIRFAGQSVKGATGLKVGREQVLALATLAIGQAALAYTAAQLTGGQWDAKRPFEMTKDGKRYTLRSVPEDIQKFMEGPRQFLHNRLSIIGKGALQYSSGVDYRGRKVTAGETTKELAQQPVPLMARGFLGIGELSGMDQLAGAVGLKVSKASPRSDLMERARDWGLNNTNAKVRAEYERREKESFPDSQYKPLRQSIEDNNHDKIVQDVADLLKNEPNKDARDKRRQQILKHFQPFTEDRIKPFATRSYANEEKFLKSLDASGKAAYREAIKEQVEQYRRLTAALYGKAQNPPIPERYQSTYGR